MKAILDKYIPIETIDGKVVFVENYNKNHGDDGRFTSGTGSSKANKTLDENLGTIAKFMSTNYKGTKDLKYTSSEDMVMKLGKNFKPAPKPKNVIQGEVKGCYKNAADLAMSSKYTYTEGYAMPNNIDLPIAHAWVVDKKGTVIDNTWKTPGSAYKGIPINTQFLMTTLAKKGTYGIIVGDGINPYLKSGLPKSAIADIKSNNDGSMTILNSKKDNDFHDYHPVEAIQNKFDEETQGLIQSQQGSLQNAIMNIEARIVMSVSNNLFKYKNAFDNNDIMTEDEQEGFKKELAILLATYYGIIIPIFGRNTANKRAQEFNLFTNFEINSDVKKYIYGIADKAASSHVQTTLNDVSSVINETYNKSVQKSLDDIRTLGRKVTDSDLVLARKKALEGASQYDIKNALKNEFNETISKVRAKAIARTETNRAFTQSQFQADLQFIKQNNLEGKAYKKWITRSDNPCAICVDLASQPPIPFQTNFANIGDELTGIYTNAKGVTRVVKQLVSFEDLAAGNAHVNCSCIYQLIIESNGVVFSNFDKDENYNKNRDADGKFTFGPSGRLSHSSGTEKVVSEYTKRVLEKQSIAQKAYDDYIAANPDSFSYDKTNLQSNIREVAFRESNALKETLSDNLLISSDAPTGLEALDDETIYHLSTLRSSEETWSIPRPGSEKSTLMILGVIEYYRRNPERLKQDHGYGSDWSKPDLENFVTQHNYRVNDIKTWNKLSSNKKAKYRNEKQYLFERDFNRVSEKLGDGNKSLEQWGSEYRGITEDMPYTFGNTDSIRRLSFRTDWKSPTVVSREEFISKINNQYQSYVQDANRMTQAKKILNSGTGEVTLYRYGAIDGSRKQANGVFFTTSKEYASTYSDRSVNSDGESDPTMFKSYTVKLDNNNIKFASSTEELYKQTFDKELFNKKMYMDDQRVNALWTGERKVHREMKNQGFDIVSYDNAPMDNGVGEILRNTGLGDGVSEVVIINKELLANIADKGVTVQ